ncbi:complex I subunit 5 family protein [Pyrodictium occultum]|nr:complex I subunit 5 family protein [Pyrodictium occultum]
MEETGLGLPLLWASVAAPAIAGTVSGLYASRIGRRGHVLLNSGSWLISLLLLLPPAAAALGGRVVLDPLWARVPGVGVFSLFLDAVGAAMALTIAVVSLLVALYSSPYMEHRFEEMGLDERHWGVYYLLYQLFTAGMLGAVMAGNGILFYLFLELTLIPSALLIVLYGYGDRVRVGLIYLVWTHLGALLYLLGLFLIHSYDFYLPGSGYVTGAGGGHALALALIVVGLAVKMAMSGLHLWLPYAHAEAPTPVSALLSPLLIGIGAYAMLRAGVGFFPRLWGSVSPILLLWALATMLYGGFLVLAQRDVKRLLAYSSISQMGYLMLGLAAANPVGETGTVLHYMAHALGKAILFGVAGVFIVGLGTRDLGELGGLLQRMPYTAAVALLGFMMISGIPPTLGMWSEVYLVFGFARWASGYGPGAFVVLAAGVAAAMTLTAVYSFLAFRNMFLGRPGRAYERAGEEGVRGLLAPLVALAVLGVALFILVNLVAGPVLSLLRQVYG